jgi:hypothetical protein
MKVIGDRISILKKEKLLSIVILPTTDKKKLGLMFLWILAWSVCGVIVLMNYFNLREQNQKLFIIIFLSFWAYYEYKIMRAFTWKKWGKEKIWIQNDILHYQREINGKGKVKEYNKDLINGLKIIDVDAANFSDQINQSFWIKGGERLEFNYQAKVVRFAMQIKDEETRTLFNEIKNFLGSLPES